MAIDITLVFVDAYGRQTTKKFESTQTVLANAITAAAALVADFLPATELGTLAIVYSQREIENNAADAGSNVDTGATIRVRLDNGKLYPFKIPGIDPALINADGSVDISDVVITDLLAHFMSAGPFRLSEGNYIVSILGGELDR